MGETRNEYKTLVGKPEERRPLGRPRRRWEDIKMNLTKGDLDNMDWIHLTRDRRQGLMKTIMNF
jgi:hypothetical protein